MWKIIESKKWEDIHHQFDWIRDMEGVIQDPIYHAEGDVAIHTKMVVEALSSLPAYEKLNEQDQEILFAVALLHDVEKRSTTVIEDDGRITSKGHARKGEYSARTILYKQATAPFIIREQIAKIVRYHGLPIWLLEKQDPLKALVQASLEVNTEFLYLFAKADILGRICEDQNEMLERVELFKEFCLEHNCFGKPRHFESDLARFHYFNKEDTYINYIPFETADFEVILLSALPGSGKDTFINKELSDYPIVSLDQIRRENGYSPADKKATGRVIQAAKEQAKSYLRKHCTFVWNATNLSKKIRVQLIDLFVSYGAKVKIVYIEVPYKQLCVQNKNRTYVVPQKVIERMIAKLEIPSLTEAHELVYKVY